MSSSMKSPDDNVGTPATVTPGSYYGNPIPYLPIDGYPGKIIAIEGTDGVGRSTQITLLREWLEVQGYGVIETGWTRSELMQPTIELAKSSNTLNKLTFVLLYATDFADRLEKEIVPALKAGFIVLSDRYIFTAMARAGVRGVDRTWIRNLYGFAIVPHLVFYLKIDEKTLIRRVLQARGMEFWESGMDMKLGDDIYESFRAYQRALLREYGSMSDEFGFRVLDARRKVDIIQDELRRQIGAFLAETDTVGVGGLSVARSNSCLPWFVARSSSLANRLPTACRATNDEQRTTASEAVSPLHRIYFGETSWKLPADSVGGLA